jgi:hypothetical protein
MLRLELGRAFGYVFAAIDPRRVQMKWGPKLLVHTTRFDGAFYPIFAAQLASARPVLRLTTS